MDHAEVLSQIADHLSECCQTRDAVITALSGVMLRQDIPETGTPRELWYKALLILERSDSAFDRLLESMRPDWHESTSFQSACTLRESLRSSSQHRKEGVEVSKGIWLMPIGLHEHSRKAAVYVGANSTTLEEHPQLSQALLEIGPAIAAQESDLHLADKLESLGKLTSKDSFVTLLDNPNHPVAYVRRVNDLVREQIAYMRQTALDSIELKDLDASGEDLPFEPIRVALECKLKHTTNALTSLRMFAQRIQDFENESDQFDGSGEEGKRLVERMMSVCDAAQRLVKHLRDSLKNRLALGNEAIPQFLEVPENQVSVLLEALRPGHRVGTPAPTLWAKTAAIK